MRFCTGRGHELTAKYRPLVDEAGAIEADSFIIEGEVIVTNNEGGLPTLARCASPAPAGRRTCFSWPSIFCI
ncbi:hypothetical protein [Mesorhizobium sp. B1-1-8]|uniref:hypothetical protein n=1 Tax=Mesorhizobium sp. B1-1-8 TaxID=2589976 RepID=UPI00299F90B1|nr:hypothetical protein [Mesorhizobium sp. B1-1-8]